MHASEEKRFQQYQNFTLSLTNGIIKLSLSAQMRRQIERKKRPIQTETF